MEAILTKHNFDGKDSGEFQTLHMPERTLPGSHLSRYRVFTTRTECVLVEAETAAEAMKASGVADPVRIIRDIPGREVLVEWQRLLNELEALTPVALAPAN